MSFRSMWIFLVGFLSLAPIIAPLPLLGGLGGFLKLVGSIFAGPLYCFHISALLLYAGVVSSGYVAKEQIRTPALVSTMAVVAIAIPAFLTLITCSPEWVESGTLQQPRSIVSIVKSNFYSPGISFAQWSRIVTGCSTQDDFLILTPIYKRGLPSVGPSSLEPTFANPTFSFALQHMGNGTQTSLKTFYYPVRPQSKRSPRLGKPGLLVYVHGGGWWNGKPVGPLLTPCHVQFAHSHGWSYAAIEYRLGRNGWSGDVQVEDVKDAIKYLHKKLDRYKVVVVGASAGGHLGLLASYQLNNERTDLKDPVISGVVAVAPSTSVEIGTGKNSIPGWAGSWDESMAHQRLCEGVEDCNAKLSPLEHVSQKSPKTILLHGGHDEYYTPHHSRALKERLAEHKIPYVHIEPPMMPHCLDLAFNTLPVQMAIHALEKLMKSLDTKQ